MVSSQKKMKRAMMEKKNIRRKKWGRTIVCGGGLEPSTCRSRACQHYHSPTSTHVERWKYTQFNTIIQKFRPRSIFGTFFLSTGNKCTKGWFESISCLIETTKVLYWATQQDASFISLRLKPGRSFKQSNFQNQFLFNFRTGGRRFPSQKERNTLATRVRT